MDYIFTQLAYHNFILNLHFITFMLYNTDYLNIILELLHITNHTTQYFKYINILDIKLDINFYTLPTTTVIQIILFLYRNIFNSSYYYILTIISDVHYIQSKNIISQHISSSLFIPTLKLRGEETA